MAHAVIELKGAEVTADNTLLDDFAGDCYEIESTFYPGAGTTKVGFKLRVGEDESTDIMYDIANETMSIDRSKSGIAYFPFGCNEHYNECICCIT